MLDTNTKRYKRRNQGDGSGGLKPVRIPVIRKVMSIAEAKGTSRNILSVLSITALLISANSLCLQNSALPPIAQFNTRWPNQIFHQSQLTSRGCNYQRDRTAVSVQDRRYARPTKLRQSSNDETSSIVGSADRNHTASNPSKILRLFTKLTRDLSVPTVLFAAFLNLLGFTMTSPIQPALGEHFSLPLGASFGSLSSAYPLGMMAGVFIWPALSDVIGRKIVMALTLFGSGMGLMLQSWGIWNHWTLEQFLATRVLTGCFAGNGPVSKAYLADRGTAQGKDLTRYLAFRDAASTMAFIAGPVLGGLLYQGVAGAMGDMVDNTKRISFVICVSALASILASTLVALFVKNSHTDEGDISSKGAVMSKNETTSSTNDYVDSNESFTVGTKQKENKVAIISCPLGTSLWTAVATVAGISGLYHAADSAFFAFFPSLLQQKLNFDTQAVGMSFTSFAFVSFAMSAFVSSRFLNTWGPVTGCVTGLGAIGIALWTLGYAASLPVSAGIGTISALILGSAGLYYSGVPLYGPSVPTMLLQCVPPRKRGFVMGLDGMVNTIARVASPLVMGEIHRRKGAGACFALAGLCTYGGVILALFRRWVVLRKQFANN